MNVGIIVWLDGWEVAVVKQEISGESLDREQQTARPQRKTVSGRRFSKRVSPNLLNPCGGGAVVESP